MNFQQPAIDDVIAIDFGATAKGIGTGTGTGTGTTNYNINNHAVSDVTDLVRLSDGAPTGVSFTQDNINPIAGNPLTRTSMQTRYWLELIITLLR